MARVKNGIRFVAVVVAAVLAALTASAQALPGDPPIVSVAPADGATVSPSSGVVPVTFQCPAYRTSDSTPGSSSDYEANFSKTSSVGSDGVLLGRFVSRTAVPGPGGTCTSNLDVSAKSGSPEVVGTRVFWQADRECSGCAGQRDEVGPVRSFVVRPAAVKGRLVVPKRLYAGYLNVFGIRADAERVERTLLQRRAGTRWRTVVAGSGSKGEDLLAKLPAGRQTLRGVLVIGDFKLVVAKRTVTVRRGGRRVTARRDDGRYKARKPSKNETLGFRVAGNGGVLKKFKSSLTAFCIGPTVNDNRFVVAFANLRSVPIAPDGSVVGQLKLKGDSSAEVTLIGRLRGRRFKGEVSVSFSTCTGTKKLDAVRAR